MPEEINRVMADHLSNMLLCPSKTAVSNLAAEGISQNVHLVGDVMLDVLNWRSNALGRTSRRFWNDLIEQAGLLTGDRAPQREHGRSVANVKHLSAFDAIDEPVVFPVHPRARKSSPKWAFQPKPHVP